MSNRKPYEIDSVSVCHLPSFITAIEKGNQQKFSQSYSDSAFYLRYSSFKSTMPQTVNISAMEFSDEAEKNKMLKSFFDLINTVERKRKIKGVVLNDTITDFLQQRKTKYAIITFNTGFTREQGNYGKELAKGVGIGILTLGMYAPIAIKANSTVICCVLDTKNRNIAFYRRKTAELEPLKPKNIERQIKALMDSFFLFSN